jgi:hypothetical protein
MRMMSDRENLGAGIYAALTALLVMVCLVGALVLPPSFFSAKWFAILALVGFFLGIPVLVRLAHRSRIREAVGKIGGTVIRIKRLPFWKQPFATKYAFFLGVQYAVEYIDLLGATHQALCNSGYFQGVEWLADSVVEGG